MPGALARSRRSRQDSASQSRLRRSLVGRILPGFHPANWITTADIEALQALDRLLRNSLAILTWRLVVPTLERPMK